MFLCKKCHNNVESLIYNKRTNRNMCIECNKNDAKNSKILNYKWRKTHKKEWLDLLKRTRIKTRIEAIIEYSPSMSCAICNETNVEFLAIDHINGSGSKHRKEIGGGSHTYAWLKKNKYPPGFRVLCHNCNFKYGKKNNCISVGCFFFSRWIGCFCSNRGKYYAIDY